jgi:ABC-type glycerol-3-phosphate transport system substrate-binding protein
MKRLLVAIAAAATLTLAGCGEESAPKDADVIEEVRDNPKEEATKESAPKEAAAAPKEVEADADMLAARQKAIDKFDGYAQELGAVMQAYDGSSEWHAQFDQASEKIWSMADDIEASNDEELKKAFKPIDEAMTLFLAAVSIDDPQMLEEGMAKWETGMLMLAELNE